MIGLGSNRLTVCRRGGMSVTQAGRGGMEWLAGGRGVSPYSAQATAALKAQFPTQWPTIRDYGFAHPEIVGYMNAYAPEDAKIAYSLVEGIGTRWIVGTGTQYFITSFKPSATDILRTKVMPTNIGSNQVPYGARNVAGQGGGGSYNNWFIGDQFRMDYAASNGETFAPNLTLVNNTAYVIEEKKGYCKVNGVIKFQQTVSAETLNYPFYVFANNNQGSVGTIASMRFAWMYKNDVPLFIPFKRNGQMELLDLVSGNLATRVGTFTELITSPS